MHARLAAQARGRVRAQAAVRTQRAIGALLKAESEQQRSFGGERRETNVQVIEERIGPEKRVGQSISWDCTAWWLQERGRGAEGAGHLG